MEIWEALVLGVTQGLTEFLPVSSSGHLVLVQQAIGLAEVPLFFDVMLHLGTLVSVVIVLFKEIVDIITRPIKNRLILLVIATIPAAVAGILLNDIVEAAFSGAVIGACFLITTGILIFSEIMATRYSGRRGITLKSSVLMGAMQVAALFPGISRSGSTIAGGLMCGTNRTKAANFAFLMSIPVILGSVVMESVSVSETGLGDVSAVTVIVGTAAAAVSGYFAVKFMLNLIKRKRLTGFAIYTAALGIYVIIDQNLIHLIF